MKVKRITENQFARLYKRATEQVKRRMVDCSVTLHKIPIKGRLVFVLDTPFGIYRLEP